MNTKRSMMILALLAVFAATLLVPSVAMAGGSTSQKNKNTWRNLAIGSGVIAGYGLLHHNTTATVLGAAGAAYSANRYEQDRKAQSAASRERARRDYYRHHRARYHRAYTPQTYYKNGRKYYHYDGHLYYQNLHSGARVRVD